MASENDKTEGINCQYVLHDCSAQASEVRLVHAHVSEHHLSWSGTVVSCKFLITALGCCGNSGLD